MRAVCIKEYIVNLSEPESALASTMATIHFLPGTSFIATPAVFAEDIFEIYKFKKLRIYKFVTDGECYWIYTGGLTTETVKLKAVLFKRHFRIL